MAENRSAAPKAQSGNVAASNGRNAAAENGEASNGRNVVARTRGSEDARAASVANGHPTPMTRCASSRCRRVAAAPVKTTNRDPVRRKGKKGESNSSPARVASGTNATTSSGIAARCGVPGATNRLPIVSRLLAPVTSVGVSNVARRGRRSIPRGRFPVRDPMSRRWARSAMIACG